MQAVLRSISSHDLLALAALGGEAGRDRVEHELDRRAAGALISRILRGAKKVDGLAVCRSAEAPVAA